MNDWNAWANHWEDVFKDDEESGWWLWASLNAWVLQGLWSIFLAQTLQVTSETEKPPCCSNWTLRLADCKPRTVAQSPDSSILYLSHGSVCVCPGGIQKHKKKGQPALERPWLRTCSASFPMDRELCSLHCLLELVLLVFSSSRWVGVRFLPNGSPPDPPFYSLKRKSDSNLFTLSCFLVPWANYLCSQIQPSMIFFLRNSKLNVNLTVLNPTY